MNQDNRQSRIQKMILGFGGLPVFYWINNMDSLKSPLLSVRFRVY